MSLRGTTLLLIAVTATGPGAVRAQVTSTGSPVPALPSRCVSMVGPLTPVSDSARSQARIIAGRAQAASIVGDNAAATALYQQAADINPTDPAIAYALGREYEATHDQRAMREYCRFLAINPGAAEAGDVRQRVAELALALPPDTTVVRIPVAAPVAASAHMPAPAGVFLGGLLIPGLGQMTTHRPFAGVLVLAASGGALAYGLQSRNKTSLVTHNAVDLLGNPYTYQTTEVHSERPNAAAGIGAAAGIALIAAIEAASHAHSVRSAAAEQQATRAISAAPLLAIGPRSLGFGLTIH
jgi:tetratricopeptide (TPR) repeat protein